MTPHRACKTRQSILDFIVAFVATWHYPPTYEEIRNGLNLSTKSLVSYHIDALEARGFIEHDRHTIRGLYIVSAAIE